MEDNTTLPLSVARVMSPPEAPAVRAMLFDVVDSVMVFDEKSIESASLLNGSVSPVIISKDVVGRMDVAFKEERSMLEPDVRDMALPDENRAFAPALSDSADPEETTRSLVVNCVSCVDAKNRDVARTLVFEPDAMVIVSPLKTLMYAPPIKSGSPVAANVFEPVSMSPTALPMTLNVLPLATKFVVVTSASKVSSRTLPVPKLFGSRAVRESTVFEDNNRFPVEVMLVAAPDAKMMLLTVAVTETSPVVAIKATFGAETIALDPPIKLMFDPEEAIETPAEPWISTRFVEER